MQAYTIYLKRLAAAVSGYNGGSFVIMMLIYALFFGSIFLLIWGIRKKIKERQERLAKGETIQTGGATGGIVMLVLGSVMTIGGTISAIYGNYQNNHMDAQRFYDAAQNLWYNGTVNRNPGDPFFIAGLVVLGVGAILLIGGIIWLILAKNRRNS